MTYAESAKKWLVSDYVSRAGSGELNGFDKKNKCRHSHILKKPELKDRILFGRAKDFSFDEPGFSSQSDAHHLNSSQMFCINFFQPIRKSRKDVLEALLKAWGVDLKGRIVQTGFEKVLSTREDTHFDFYVETDLCERVFFEIKYTENCFSSVNFESARAEFYRKWLSYSGYLADLPINELEAHYQIYRNISYVRSSCDYVVFLFPYGNAPLKREMNQIGKKVLMKNVKWVNAEEIVLHLTEVFKNVKASPQILNHYHELIRRYFGWYVG